jgi:nicotinamide-nucleotide amidase
MSQAERVGELLLARGWKIAVAESTAGGLISAALLTVPGASRYYERGVIAYSRAAKLETLGMPPELYTERGSTHQAAVRAMAEGVRRLSDTQVGVAESGVAGPGVGPLAPCGLQSSRLSAGWSASCTCRAIGRRSCLASSMPC